MNILGDFINPHRDTVKEGLLKQNKPIHKAAVEEELRTQTAHNTALTENQIKRMEGAAHSIEYPDTTCHTVRLLGLGLTDTAGIMRHLDTLSDDVSFERVGVIVLGLHGYIDEKRDQYYFCVGTNADYDVGAVALFQELFQLCPNADHIHISACNADRILDHHKVASVPLLPLRVCRLTVVWFVWRWRVCVCVSVRMCSVCTISLHS